MCIHTRDLYIVPVGISFQYSVQRLSNKRSNENPLFLFSSKNHSWTISDLLTSTTKKGQQLSMYFVEKLHYYRWFVDSP